MVLLGIFRDDRRRVELIVRHFIPDFFGFPRATIAEEEPGEEEEEEEERKSKHSCLIENSLLTLLLF